MCTLSRFEFALYFTRGKPESYNPVTNHRWFADAVSVYCCLFCLGVLLCSGYLPQHHATPAPRSYLGGSTEFILGESNHHIFRKSFPLGSLRLLERFPPHDPPTLDDVAASRGWLSGFFKEKIMPVIQSLLAES